MIVTIKNPIPENYDQIPEIKNELTRTNHGDRNGIAVRKPRKFLYYLAPEKQTKKMNCGVGQTEQDNQHSEFANVLEMLALLACFGLLCFN